MAFPSTTGTRSGLDAALTKVQSLAGSIKSECLQLKTASAAGPVNARYIVNLSDSLANKYDILQTAKAVPGLEDYAKAQYNDATFDISAEFAAMETAIANVVAWIAANIPKDSASNRWLAIEEMVNGKRADRQFTSAQTVTLRTVLDSLIATID